MNKDLPLYRLAITDDENGEEEVDFVALVEYPAIQKNFIAFADQSCPIATQDIKINLKNRQNAIDVAYYGPLNPNLPSVEYWSRKAKQFNATIEEAKKSICGNCSFFNVSKMIKDCIAGGIGNELDPYNVIDAGDLGYCEAFDFKCASKRTCDAWVLGGPQKFEDEFKFEIQNEDERIVSGPLMVADLPIYRRDAEGEYYVVFTGEVIKNIVQRFFKKGYQAKVNLEHEKSVEGVYMFESYIVDRKKGILPMKGFEGIADGSWFGSFKVDNEEIWMKVKDGTFKGFSVEGLFKYERTNKVVNEDEEIMSDIINILNKIEQK